MRFWGIAAVAPLIFAASPALGCETGLYASPDGREQVAITNTQSGETRYMFADGRRGKLGQLESPLSCAAGSIRSAAGPWTAVPLRMTESSFESHGETLSGTLVEPPDPAARPLVVMVHGSERTPPMQGAYPYILAAHGLSVFAYDKRGTGRSEGEYTQNFELLADDAAAAFAEASRIASGRYTRAGYFGGSQGGWVAPLAATRTPADFVAVGFGLTASPLEEDRAQVLTEMRQKGYGPADRKQALDAADAAGRLVASHFVQGFDELAAVKRRYGARPWFRELKGEFTGAILRSDEADLRRVGRALYDNLELIWDYDATATIRRVRVPQLWVIAEQDREAPPETTLSRLKSIRDEGKSITIYSFPDTDHGMVEFTQAADGSRTYGRITDGYFRLVADWIKGSLQTSYGRARRH